MSPAIRSLVGTLSSIKSGKFRPDESRSGRFVEAPRAHGNAAEDATQLDTVDGSACDAEDSESSEYCPSSSESEDSEDDIFNRPSESTLLWHLVTPDLRPGYVEIPDSFLVYRNNASGVQHLRKPGASKFLCGRRVVIVIHFSLGSQSKMLQSVNIA